MSEHLNSATARLEMNARGHRYDPGMERIADLMDAGDYAAWSALPPAVVSQASMYRDFRAQYRRAVDAGAIADTQTPTKEAGA